MAGFKKQFGLLKGKEYGDKSGLFFMEGEKFIDEISNSYSGVIIEYFISRGYAAKHPDFAARAGVPVTALKDSVFESYASNKSPQGRIALCKKTVHTLNALLENRKENSLFILAEELNDPGNLGAIIRTACAADASGVILSTGSVGLYNPKTLQSAAGTVFHVPIVENADLTRAIHELRDLGIKIFAACPKAALSLYEADFTKPTALLIGNEARGLSENAKSLADSTVYIPMPGSADSLNVSAACAILIYEAVRQRERIRNGG